ncbi:glycosyltransferase family 1 protein [Streptococcus henryi]|uniref:glycosyltransferase family 1 protein n=1 Tax=Streptococcus henryi TaxID=439219 RepID=UPI00036EE3A8|nr:glycosyltransferase family 1 protein [Streptococcus henryi]
MNDKIRIAMIMGKWVGGGVEAVVMNYYKNINHEKIQFDFIFDDDSRNIPTDEILSMGGKIFYVPSYSKALNYHKQLKRILHDHNYRIVHSHINTLSVFSLYAAKCAGVPIRIAHSHSTSNSKEISKNLLKQFLRPFSKLFATDYMTCSELAGRWLFGNHSYDKGNVYLLNNAINAKKFKFSPVLRNEIRNELSLNDDTVVFGHIGRFVKQKNHDFLIDIFYEICNLNENSLLLLVGEGPLKEEIESKVKVLGLENKVVFLGQRSDAFRLYQAFDIFLLPSLYEGLPVVGVESQASGLQCFFSDDMTKETKILDSTKFLSLDLSPLEWANNIMSDFFNFTRKDTESEVRNHGFEISTEAEKLEKKYLELWKRL